MKLCPVILESPFAGQVLRNIVYARLCAQHCLIECHETPFPSHLLYTQDGILDDRDLEQRELGIEAGLVWGRFAQRTVVYTDLGVSGGMERGIKRAHDEGRPVVMRMLRDWRERVQAQIAQTIEHKLSSKAAECNTYAIELALAKKRHQLLGNVWSVIEAQQRWLLYGQIFEGSGAA